MKAHHRRALLAIDTLGIKGEVGMSVVGNFGDVQNNPNLTFTTSDLPLNTFGIVASSLPPQPAGITIWNGVFTVQLGLDSGSMTRHYETLSGTGSTGIHTGSIDVPSYYSPLMGTNVYFQTWHRDVAQAMAIFNFSDAVGVMLWQ